MILGAIDVVPHQDIANPAFDAPDDPDRNADGDLPYACDAPYSRDIATFKGPSRVVGRLPDLTRAKEPSYILSLLSIAARYQSNCYGLWRLFRVVHPILAQVDGAESVQCFRKLHRADVGPAERAAALPAVFAPLAHFINCHGGQADPVFYGEKGNSQPESLTSRSIAGKIKPGTVAAVECCYGAELYDW